MRKVLFASNNKGKIAEIKRILGEQFEVYSIADLNIDLDSIENGSTFHQNALIKTQDLQSIVGNEYIILSDDSGIIVDSLPNELGVFTARFSGDSNKETKDVSNNNLLIQKMNGVENRNARYKAVICCINNSEIRFFEGNMELEVANEIKLEGNGFAFDFCTISKEFGKFVCELSNEEKDSISHRGEALRKLSEYLR